MPTGFPRKQEGASPFPPPGAQLPTSIPPVSRDWGGAAGKATKHFSEPPLQHHKAGNEWKGEFGAERPWLNTAWGTF